VIKDEEFSSFRDRHSFVRWSLQRNDFVKHNWDALIARLPTDSGASLPYVAADFCDGEHRADAQAFFESRSTKYTGGPRILAEVLERISLCLARKPANEAGVAEFLSKN
jgi:hypothetical protein